jgi:hypothetical protein
MLLKLTWTTRQTTWCGTAASCGAPRARLVDQPYMASLSMIKFFKNFAALLFPAAHQQLELSVVAP